MHDLKHRKYSIWFHLLQDLVDIGLQVSKLVLEVLDFRGDLVLVDSLNHFAGFGT